MIKACKKKIAIFLAIAAAVVSAGGCGGTGDGSNTGADPAGGTGGDSSSSAMGRYVEEVTDLSDQISGRGNGLYQLSDGNLLISDKSGEFMKTGDGGDAWMKDTKEWWSEMLEDGVYVMSMAVGPDNTVALIRQVDADDTSKDEAAAGDADTSETEMLDKEEDSLDDPSSFQLNPQILIIKPDNTEIPVEIQITESEAYLYQIYIADNGRIFASTMGGSDLYEIKEDGSGEPFLALDGGRPEQIRFRGNLMLIDGHGYEGPVLYDMEKEEYIEDEVLTEFVSTNYGDRNNSYDTGDIYELYYFFGGDDILYLAGEKGLYRHVIGGSVMEQIIDGELCSLGNPSYRLQGMLPLENNEFLALFEGAKMIHYVYDPDIPTKPSEKITLYALEDNETIRQAINLYQVRNPEVYIEFELGMDKNSSITKEDAIKSLNTKIMAGEGPDVLLLDNMPLDSYIEKGLLLDLSPLLDEVGQKEPLFSNITEAVKKDGKVYAMPCEVRIPVMLADKKYLSGVQDIEDVADMVEALRADNPGKDLLGFCSEKGIMRLFSMACVPAWITDNGELDRDAVAQFLKQTKRIYDAQMDGIPESVVENYEAMNEYYAQYVGAASYDDTDDIRTGTDAMSYLGGLTQMVNGVFSVFDSFNGYNMFTSIQRVEGFENTGWMTMKGQCDNVFWAETLLGISTASNNSALAEDFVKSCFGKENQTSLYYGLPVNIAAFEKYITPEDLVDEDGVCGSYIVSNDEGLYVHLEVYWPDDALLAEFRKCMEEVETPYFKNDLVEYAVYEEGIAYLQGTKSLDEAVEGIEKKISLYLSE